MAAITLRFPDSAGQVTTSTHQGQKHTLTAPERGSPSDLYARGTYLRTRRLTPTRAHTHTHMGIMYPPLSGALSPLRRKSHYCNLSSFVFHPSFLGGNPSVFPQCYPSLPGPFPLFLPHPFSASRHPLPEPLRADSRCCLSDRHAP